MNDEKSSDWTLYRSFLAVLREGSLSQAARRLSLTQPTLSRHISQLETSLGLGSLFARSPQGLAPTEAALALAPHAAAMDAAAAAIRRAASGDPAGLSGVVRIAASEVVGGEVLPAMLRDLRRRHPGLSFEVELSKQTADILRRDADIAVRMVRPKQSALLARKIGAVKLGVFAHPAYLAEHGVPASVAELADHAIVGFDRDAAGGGVLGDFGAQLKRLDFAYRTDDQVAQLAAIRAGCGIGICQVALARRAPVLTRLFAAEADFGIETWLTMHEDMRGSRRIRAVFDFLADAFADYVREGLEDS